MVNEALCLKGFRVKNDIYECREERDIAMYEKEFNLIEGREMSLVELGREIENITGYTIVDATGEIQRNIALKPNFKHDWETYTATYRLNHKNDFVDAIFTTIKGQDVTQLKNKAVKIQLISYISRA